MIVKTPEERRRSRLMRRWNDPHWVQAVGMFGAGGGMGGAMIVHIHRKYHLYSSSTTMTLIGCVTAAVMFVVIALLSKRWYAAAWIVTLTAPPVLFLLALRILERHPPVPPLG